MNSLPKLAEELISEKQQAEHNLSSFLDKNFPENSSDFLLILQSYPTLETLRNFITTFINLLLNETFTISHQKLINRSFTAILSEFSKISNDTNKKDNFISVNNIELETLKDKLNDSHIQIQTYQNNLKIKDEIIDQLNSDNSELEKNIALLKAKILKKKEKIDDLRLKNRQINLNLDEKKISMINDNLTSTISYLNDNRNNEELYDEIYSLANTIKFNDFEYQKLLDSKRYCLNICQRLLDLSEEYESRLSMVEEDKAMLNRQIYSLTNENSSLKKSINESIRNESLFLSEIGTLKSQISNETSQQYNQNSIMNQDQKIQNEIENLNDIITTQRNFIGTLSTYINRLLIDGNNYIPLLYQSNQVINDTSLRQIVIETVESIKTDLLINDYMQTEDQKDIESKLSHQINLRNDFFKQIFGSQEILEKNIDKFISENKEDYQGFAVIIALCAANINLGLRFTNIHSKLTKIYSQLPQEFQNGDLFLSFQSFLSDSEEILDKFNLINNTSSFFNFKSDKIKTSFLNFIDEISKFTSSLQEIVYPIIRYNKTSLIELPVTFANTINNIQAQNNALKSELEDYKDKYQKECISSNSQQRYSDEVTYKIKEKDKQINQLMNEIENKDKGFQDLKISSESIIKEKDLTIKNFEIELNKIQKENETNILLLKNTKKLYKSQIDNVVKIEKEKRDKEIKELKETYNENETTYIQKLESKRKKIKTLQNQIKEITKIYEKKIKKNKEAAENLLNETNEQINLVEESFKQKEEQYQNEIEMLKGKLLEEIQQNSTIKIIEVPTVFNTSSDSKNDIFIKQIINILSKFPNSKLNLKSSGSYSTEIVKSNILNALEQLTNEVKSNSSKSKINENLDNSNSTIIRFPTGNSLSSLKSPIVSAKRVVNTRDLRIWESWAVDIASAMNVPTNSFPDIRTAIRDVILSIKSKSFMLLNIQSLRIQKKLLIENDLFNLKFSMRQKINLKGIIFFYISASCIFKTCKTKANKPKII